MTRLFIFSLMAIVVALWVSLYLGFPADPGYLLIAFGNTTFETSLFAMLIAVATIASQPSLSLSANLSFSDWPLSSARPCKPTQVHEHRVG